MRSAISGSSPHTRGARVVCVVDLEDQRIIPAYAGSTEGSAAGRSGRRDHPRIRGEHRHADPRRDTGVRIIPAYAGSTREGLRLRVSVGGSSPHTRGAPASRPVLCGARGDHPRIRGEHSATHDTTLTMPGSSPHTRGARR